MQEEFTSRSQSKCLFNKAVFTLFEESHVQCIKHAVAFPRQNENNIWDQTNSNTT